MYILALQKQNINECSIIRNLVPLEYQFSNQNWTIVLCSEAITKIHENPESGYQATSNS